jgi:hypothetical protein
MLSRCLRERAWCAVLVGLTLALIAPVVAAAATLHVKLVAKTGESGFPPAGVVRSADGTLHVVFGTKVNWGNSADGIGATSISAAGHIGAQVQALSGWNAGIPGLVPLPSGQLEAVFGGGADNGSTGANSGPWGIVSSDGGATWSAPADVGSGTMEAFAGDITAHLSGSTPVLTVPGAGGLVIQSGLGAGSPVFGLDTAGHGSLGNVDAALDATSGALVASWYSSDTSAGLWMQQVAPVGAAQKVPGPLDTAQRQQLVLAGRDKGPGVFAAYAPDQASNKIRLLRYGGGSVAVGSIKDVHAYNLGVATGLDGRIWVMWWGPLNGHGVIGITRSNKADTRFEPIQRYQLDSAYMWRIFGDGRLGPLDLLVNEVPTPPAGTPAGQGLVNGIYWARVLPELSAHASAAAANKAKTKFVLAVKVSDAGDAVAGAKVTALGKSAKTSNQGIAKLTVSGSQGQTATVTITAPGYQTLKVTKKL